MATQAALLARVRLELGEASAAIWSDARLNEFLDQVLEEYNGYWSKQAVTTSAVSAGETEVTAPAAAVRVVRVVLEDGTILPTRHAMPGTRATDELQAWEVFAGTVYFTQALSAQTLTLFYLADHDYADIPARDEGLIVAGAVWKAVQGREMDDLRRQGVLQTRRHGFTVLDARREYMELLDAARRRVRQT